MSLDRNYKGAEHGKELIVLSVGDFEAGMAVPCRVQDQCITSEVFHSLKCDCAGQLKVAMQYIQRVGRGLLIYVQQEGLYNSHPAQCLLIFMHHIQVNHSYCHFLGRGIGIGKKIAAYHAQGVHGLDTVDANEAVGAQIEARRYDALPAVLQHFRVESIRLMSNNPFKASASSWKFLSAIFPALSSLAAYIAKRPCVCGRL